MVAILKASQTQEEAVMKAERKAMQDYTRELKRQHEAAVLVQRRFRGHRARRMYKEKLRMKRESREGEGEGEVRETVAEDAADVLGMMAELKANANDEDRQDAINKVERAW